MVPSQGERLKILYNTLYSRENMGIETITYFYCQQKIHQFNHCAFVNDRLRQLLKNEMMNVHQPIIPTITSINYQCTYVENSSHES
jgi:hypothetical protein